MFFEYISKGVIKSPINVKYPHFNGSVELLDDGRWATYGIVNKEKTGRKEYYVISELPIGYDREKYFSFLLKLKEAGKISDFDHSSNKNKEKTLKNYGIGAQILLDLGIKNMTLLTNSEKSVIGLEGYGIKICGYIKP